MSNVFIFCFLSGINKRLLKQSMLQATQHIHIDRSHWDWVRLLVPTMAFPSRVIRTYGRHKKRTIAANVWISPENETKSQQHVFSSPELCDFSIDLNTDSHSSALTNSNRFVKDKLYFFGAKKMDEQIPL